MAEGIVRRDFLNGMAVALGAAVATPGRPLASEPADPPALGGMRGSHDGAFEVAHRLALGGERFDIAGLPTTERYDLVVVGAGISGLSAAFLYRERFGPETRILILDNHDDFGGHARRNEFRVGGRLLIGYGGSESLQSPRANFSPTVSRVLAQLGLDLDRLATAFDRRLFRDLGLSRVIFFDRETFGTDRLVGGDPTTWVSDDTVPGERVERDVAAFIADFPLSESARAELTRLHVGTSGRLGAVPEGGREELLRRTSYPDFLRRFWNLGDEALLYFRQRTADYFGSPPGYLSAWDCWHAGYPGFGEFGEAASASVSEPYIHHFPDGNASIARLLVRALVPAAVGGGPGMEGIVLARVHYDQLDRPGDPVRIRLRSTAVRADNMGGGVAVGYVREDDLRRIEARHCVMAGWNMAIPYIVPEAAPAQAEALHLSVKLPLVYVNVALRDWTALARLRVHDVYAPAAFFSRVKLDYPVSLGGYRYPGEPTEPALLHLVHVPTRYDPSQTASEAYRTARYQLLGTPFETFEQALRDQLGRMLGPGGFEPERDIRAITVNRWSHGYSNWDNPLVRPGAEQERIVRAASRPIGRIAIANCDRRWDAYLHAAIDAAADAVGELPA